MKVLKIIHNTRYTYGEPVFLETHYLKFRPLYRSYLKVNNFDLEVSPTPSGISERVDAEGNSTFQVWFSNLTGDLNVRVSIRVSVQQFNSMDFLVDPLILLNKPGSFYPHNLRHFIKPYTETEYSQKLKIFISEIITNMNGELIPSLATLLQELFENWEHQIVEDEEEPNAMICFDEKRGSCKDLAWMMMSMLRSAGLASRFVSGYAYNRDLDEGHELHAWVEVLLPGAGWIGMDPSSGLFTNECYIPVACSYDPANTMPVTGSFRGNQSNSSRMETDVKIEAILEEGS